MKNLGTIFNNEEVMELCKKNMDFAFNLVKENSTNSNTIIKERVNEYFDIVNKNMELISENYEKALTKNEEIAQLYKENIEKTSEIAKKMTEKLRNRK
ncbi:MAG: hypothetical protein C0601_05680 [Candidatus Muiribacterium halophilum]|uniref:Phasin domain-containing protein n=1 Tax=Muiribacterium halophilum TaxID=2053465 RepID=A0A2N5ZHI2_MUIH1|nr:MAG: hypothetical protein C0601_05680 [Candidatus Muirbacterium halophilum]